MSALPFLLHAAVDRLKMSGNAIVSALWRLNVYGAVMASLLFDGTERKHSWCWNKKTYQNYVQKTWLF